ncbi:MAG TPA: YfhO family protein, partial [Methylomirabilota bacterium]|nr:YfhO family protein [Methylomirabilota bacterium]
MDSTNVTTAPSRRADLLAVALLLLLPLLFAAAMLAAGLALSPVANLFTSYPWQALGADAGAPNAALSDVTQWFHPALLWGAREIRAGRLPLWMPTAYTGVPFFANPQTALLFPLTWLAWILPAGAALTLITVLKLAGAGLATYWFLRVGPGLTVPAALIGSLGFEFSTTLVGWAGWAFGNEIVCLPLLFAGVERVRAAGARRWTVALAVIVALTIVAGYPQGAFHALLAAGAWTLLRARGAARGFLVRSVLAALLGAGLAAVQVAPFLEYLRASAVYAYRSQWMAPLSVPPTAAITLALPYAFGSAADAWGPWQFNIASTYVGLVPLLLLPLGVAAGRHRPGGRFFILYMVVVAAVHYGLPGAAQIARLPGLSLGANLRLMPHLDFAVCVLGALGADALARREAAPGGWPVRLAVVVIVLTAFGWVAAHHDLPGARGLAWSLDRQFVLALAGLTLGALLALRWLATGAAAWGAALVALQALSVAPPALAYLPRAPARWLYPEAPAIAWLRAHAGVDRVLMPGHVGPLYGLAEAHGYDGLTPRRVAELVGSVGTGIALVHGYIQNPLEGVGSEALSPVAVLASPVVDLLGVRYVMLPADAAPIW